MNDQKRKAILRNIFNFLTAFLFFFVTIGGVVTICFYILSSTVSIPDEKLIAAAPYILLNVIILSILFVVVDAIRRKVSIDRAAKKIQKVLKQLAHGDFNARISGPFVMDPNNNFAQIAHGINLLADELSSVETLRTDFVANVSHELKTPLAVMQNYGTMLQQPELSEEKRIEYAKSITNACKRLANLITNILKLSKLENQQIYPVVKEYDLSEQLCECLLQYEDAWEQKGLNIETDVDDEVIIRSDAELLSLVWNNLFSNAIKFTESGGTVSVSLKSTDNYITVKVTDTGCGMSQEVGAHIFDKFYQGDTSHSTQGNGLGLALVKRVVDIMQGEIEVESAVGKGSTFIVRFQRL